MTQAIFMIFLMSLVSVIAQSAEKKSNHRHHGAHQHGVVRLNIAFDGASGKIEIDAPAKDIIGFEYQAKTQKDIDKQKEEISKLETKIASMLVFSDLLKCEISKEKIEVVYEKENKNHSDIEAVFSINCKKSPLNTELIFNIQTFFPDVHEVEVQVLVDDLQKSFEVTKSGAKLLLK